MPCSCSWRQKRGLTRDEIANRIATTPKTDQKKNKWHSRHLIIPPILSHIIHSGNCEAQDVLSPDCFAVQPSSRQLAPLTSSDSHSVPIGVVLSCPWHTTLGICKQARCYFPPNFYLRLSLIS